MSVPKYNGQIANRTTTVLLLLAMVATGVLMAANRSEANPPPLGAYQREQVASDRLSDTLLEKLAGFDVDIDPPSTRLLNTDRGARFYAAQTVGDHNDICLIVAKGAHQNPTSGTTCAPIPRFEESGLWIVLRGSDEPYVGALLIPQGMKIVEPKWKNTPVNGVATFSEVDLESVGPELDATMASGERTLIPMPSQPTDIAPGA